MASENATILKGERMLSVRETAQIMGWCMDSVRRHLRSGTMPGIRAGRNWRIPESQLRSWLQSGRNEFNSSDTTADQIPPSNFDPQNYSPPSSSITEFDNDVLDALFHTKPAQIRVLYLARKALEESGAPPTLIERALTILETQLCDGSA